MKAFADDKINVAEMKISLSDTVENNVGKGENAGYRHFLLFPQCYQKPSLLHLQNLGLYGKELRVAISCYHKTKNHFSKETQNKQFNPFPNKF